jgi:hypothetical protein
MEFLMVVLPLSALFLLLLQLFGFAYSSLYSQQRVLEVARYAALADVDSADVQHFVSGQDFNVDVSRVFIAGSCLSLAKATFAAQVAGYVQNIDLKGLVTCEN